MNKTWVIAPILVTMSLLGTPVATADADGFVGDLQTVNAWLPRLTAQQVIDAGYQACNHLRAGTTVLDETDAVERAYHFNQGTLFVSLATTHLCPDFAG